MGWRNDHRYGIEPLEFERLRLLDECQPEPGSDLTLPTDRADDRPEVVASIPLMGRKDGQRYVRAYTLVDSDRVEDLRAFNWCLTSEGYAARNIDRNRKSRTVFLHREIAGAVYGDKRQVDHINRNRLDNRRTNLRIVDGNTNRQNTSSRGGSSRYRGVSYEQGRGRWVARVELNGRRHYLGVHATEHEAALAVEAFRVEHMPWVTPDPALELPAAPSAAGPTGNAGSRRGEPARASHPDTDHSAAA